MGGYILAFIAGCVFMMSIAVLMEWDDRRIDRKRSKKRAERRRRSGGSGLSL